MDTEPLTRRRSSTGRGTGPCCTACGSPASLRCSTCCGPSGWCRRAASGRSGRSGSGSPGCCRSWCSTPSPLRSIWTKRHEQITEEKHTDWQKLKRIQVEACEFLNTPSTDLNRELASTDMAKSPVCVFAYVRLY